MTRRQATGFEGVPPAILDVWRAAQQESVVAICDPGPEYLSVEQLSRLWGITKSQARKRVNALKRDGRLVMKLRDVRRTNGAAYPHQVFKMKDPK